MRGGARRRARTATAMTDRRHIVDVALPLATWLVAYALARLAGFAMSMPWHFMQVLDEPVLGAHPIASLCYLHSQPPLLNALIAGVLATARVLGTSPESVGAVVFAAMGATAAVVLYRTARALTASAALAAVALVIVVADPAYHVWSNMLFYEFVVHALLVGVVWATVRCLHGAGRACLVALSLLLGTLVATRTLFHPLWAIAFWSMVVWMRARTGTPTARRDVLAALLVLIVLLVAWPLKNAIVYGTFSEASMSAFNLARGVPGCDRAELPAPPPTQPIVDAATRWCGEDGAAALTAPLKTNGIPNFNWALHLAEAPAETACAIAWARANPGDWLGRAAGQYTLWTRPSFEMAHVPGMLIGPPSPPYRRYAQLLRETLFADLRPNIERAYPAWFLHRYAVLRDMPMAYTVFGFVVFPLFVVALLVRAVRRRREPAGAIAVALLVVVLSPMAVSCLTDGVEGNRMRFSSSFVVPLGVCWLAARGPRRATES
jgi:hypothetical protein